MKKKILGAVAVVAIAAMARFNLNINENSEFPELTLNNIEALADDESGGGSNSWSCWSQEKSGSGYWRCGNPCQFIDGAGGKGTESKCYKS